MTGYYGMKILDVKIQCIPEWLISSSIGRNDRGLGRSSTKLVSCRAHQPLYSCRAAAHGAHERRAASINEPFKPGLCVLSRVTWTAWIACLQNMSA